MEQLESIKYKSHKVQVRTDHEEFTLRHAEYRACSPGLRALTPKYRIGSPHVLGHNLSIMSASPPNSTNFNRTRELLLLLNPDQQKQLHDELAVRKQASRLPASPYSTTAGDGTSRASGQRPPGPASGISMPPLRAAGTSHAEGFVLGGQQTQRGHDREDSIISQLLSLVSRTCLITLWCTNNQFSSVHA